MSTRSLLSWPGLLRTFSANARLTWRLLREPRVPMYLKAVPVAALLYVVSPIDLVPDLLPFLGEIDDVAIVLVALRLFQSICPDGAVAFHRGAIARGARYAPMQDTDGYIDV